VSLGFRSWARYSRTLPGATFPSTAPRVRVLTPVCAGSGNHNLLSATHLLLRGKYPFALVSLPQTASLSLSLHFVSDFDIDAPRLPVGKGAMVSVTHDWTLPYISSFCLSHTDVVDAPCTYRELHGHSLLTATFLARAYQNARCRLRRTLSRRSMQNFYERTLRCRRDRR
jgi:hypothetical protein